jgi:hypothetical protein
VVFFRLFSASFWLIGEELWELEDDESEKSAGKTWWEDGENMVRTWLLGGESEVPIEIGCEKWSQS